MSRRSPAQPSLAPVARPRLYEQVAEQIMAWVEEAGLQPGDRLPAERELAARLGVSRATVAQALVAMEVVGAVTVRHGDGAILQDRTGAPALAHAVRRHAENLPDVIEAREALECALAGFAAERRTDEDLAAIDAALEAMADDIAAGGRGVEGDEQFHAAVTQAGHSSILARMMGDLAALIRESRIQSLSQPGRPRVSLEGHHAVADAIRSRDADGARRAMGEHVALVSDVALTKG